MRYIALSVTLVLMLATPASASWYPRFSAADVQVNVGERAHLTVTAMWSGLIGYGDPGVHFAFTSDNPAVATGTVQLDGTTPQKFDVTGVSPGVAHIQQTGTGFSYVTVRVVCAPEYPAVAAQPVVQAEIGHDVHLIVVTEYENRSAFRWYLGKLGDTSHPLGRSSADAIYTPVSIGSQYIWAEVTTVCSAHQLQFRVDVAAAPRQRAVRH